MTSVMHARASGEKSLYSAVGAELVATGFGAVIPDYCKYPDAEMPTIEAELIDCIKWVVAHGGAYGLDATRITLIGHSAGAHICAAVLLSLAAASCNNALIGNGGDVDGTIVHQDEHGDEAEGGYADGNVGKARFLSRIVAFVGAAGVYNIANHFEHEAKRGLEWVSPMHRVMQGKSNFDLHSPAPKVRRLSMLGGGPLDHAALAKLAVLAAGASTAATPAGGRIYLNADADADVNNTSGGNINDGGGGGGGGQLVRRSRRVMERQNHVSVDKQPHPPLRSRSRYTGSSRSRSRSRSRTVTPTSILNETMPGAYAVHLSESLRHCQMHVLHGTDDTTVPVSSSHEFCKELRAAKVEVEAHIYDSVDHMELLLSFMSDSNGGRLKNVRLRRNVRHLLSTVCSPRKTEYE